MEEEKNFQNGEETPSILKEEKLPQWRGETNKTKGKEERSGWSRKWVRAALPCFCVEEESQPRLYVEEENPSKMHIGSLRLFHVSVT